MFLFTITKSPLGKNFDLYNVEEIRLNSFLVSILTDNFLAKHALTSTGFKIVESPLVSSTQFSDITYSKIEYIEADDTVSVYNAAISGRPIYYHINSAGEFFCSTHIHLFKRAGVVIEENLDALPEFFVYRFVMPPRTLYKNINQLCMGDLIKISMGTGKCTIVDSQKFNPLASRSGIDAHSDDEISGQTLELLSESITRLNPVKDKIAVLLSGGLDSSILFKLCLKNYQTGLTYSTGYPFENSGENTEKEYALSAARAFGSEHVYYKASEVDYFRGFIEAVSAAEVPIHHLQSVMLYLLFKSGIPASKNIVLLGQGADAISGSSLHDNLFKSQRFLRKLFSRNPLYQIVKLVPRITGRGSVFLETVDIGRKCAPLSDPDNIVWSFEAYGSERWVVEYFRVTKEDIIKERYESIRRYENEYLLDVLTLVRLFGDGFVSQFIWSKLAESQKKIAYYPFYSPELIAYLFSIRWRMKLKSPKYILREVAKKLSIPEFVISRPKSSFGLQVEGWASRGGTFEPFVALASKVFDIAQIRHMQSSDSKKAMTFWNILNYSVWKRLCIENEPPEVLIAELNKQLGDRSI